MEPITLLGIMQGLVQGSISSFLAYPEIRPSLRLWGLDALLQDLESRIP